MRCLVKIFLSEQRLETSAINSEVSSTLMQNTSIPSHRSCTLVHDAGNEPDPMTRKSGTPQRLLPDCRYTRYTALCNYNDNYCLGNRSNRSNKMLLPCTQLQIHIRIHIIKVDITVDKMEARKGWIQLLRPPIVLISSIVINQTTVTKL